MIEEQTAIGKYKLIKRVGEGSYGVVYKAHNPTTGTVVALKKITIEAGEEGIPIHCLREVGILKKLVHPNIVKMHDVLYHANERRVIIVFEYIDKNLSQMIDDKSSSSLNPYLCKVFYSHPESYVSVDELAMPYSPKQNSSQGH